MGLGAGPGIVGARLVVIVPETDVACPLRSALEKLQKKIDAEYELAFSKFNVDPWMVRDRYIAFENCSWKKFRWFLEKQCGIGSLDRQMVLSFKRLLEAQKYSLFSFTSCGWFFSDISGIETVQNLAYACRALQLGTPESKRSQILDDFLKDLESAKSNLPNINGRTLIEQHIMTFLDHQMILAFTASILKPWEYRDCLHLIFTNTLLNFSRF